MANLRRVEFPWFPAFSCLRDVELLEILLEIGWWLSWAILHWDRASMPPVFRCPRSNISVQTAVPDDPSEFTNPADYCIKRQLGWLSFDPSYERGPLRFLSSILRHSLTENHRYFSWQLRGPPMKRRLNGFEKIMSIESTRGCNHEQIEEVFHPARYHPHRYYRLELFRNHGLQWIGEDFRSFMVEERFDS